MTNTTAPAATLGSRIAATRKHLDLTQQALAEQLRVTPQAVSKWETDASMPDVALLAPLAAALGLGLDQLVTGAGFGEAPSGEAAAAPRAQWGRITGTISKDIHGDTGKIVGEVQADIYGDVHGDIVGDVQNVFGNVTGNVIGDVHGDITGYVGGNLLGTVHGHVKLGVRGKILGTIVGDGINVDLSELARREQREARRMRRRAPRPSAG